jgi:hypothetical protein
MYEEFGCGNCGGTVTTTETMFFPASIQDPPGHPSNTVEYRKSVKGRSVTVGSTTYGVPEDTDDIDVSRAGCVDCGNGFYILTEETLIVD